MLFASMSKLFNWIVYRRITSRQSFCGKYFIKLHLQGSSSLSAKASIPTWKAVNLQ